MEPVCLVGNFPPPVNGQTLATQRLAGLLAPSRAVRCLDTSAGGERVRAETRWSLGRALHYLRLRRRLRQALAALPGAPVLWASISPTVPGHLRDVLTVLPAFGAERVVYAVVHWGDFDRVFRHRLTAPTARRMARRLRGVVFLNEQLSERCAPWIAADRRVVIPNTIDEAVRCAGEEVAARQAARRGRKTLRLLYLSNMIASKGYLDVLEAVRLLHGRGLALHADFAGRWSAEADRADFERRVEAGRLGAVVTHHGGVSDRARIKALHLQADVLLLPSYYPTEAQPLALIEALNAGTPVVVTRHAGIPEMVREGEEALFVPPRAPEAVAAAVERLADYDRWRGFSERARRRFETRYSPDAVRRRWEALLDEDEAEQR